MTDESLGEKLRLKLPSVEVEESPPELPQAARKMKRSVRMR
jgi:hypothetical protein